MPGISLSARPNLSSLSRNRKKLSASKKNWEIASDAPESNLASNQSKSASALLASLCISGYAATRIFCHPLSTRLFINSIEPLSIRQIELTSVILLLVSANKGVSVLPDWALQSSRETDHLNQKRLTKKGTSRKLYAAVRRHDSEKLYIKTFLSLSKNILSRLST